MMVTHYLDKLFNPQAIAVVGASERKNSVGQRVFSNLLKGNFSGKIFAVNPKHTSIQGQLSYPVIGDIPAAVDLAVITTRAATVPAIITECGEKGIKAAIVISAGFSETGAAGKELEQSMLQAARPYGLRLIGPNCLGVMRPSIHLNASFDNSAVLPGKIALVSQSGAIAAAILDWAATRKIGFSSIVSLGNAADLDFGEILDFLALDAETESILLYIEGVHQARRFMSGLRSAARIKPVVVIKGGRHAQGSRAAHSHTGALVGDDDAFDAALRRAGAVRVLTIKQLFSAADIFAGGYRVNGNRLAVITNGGGAGVMAADRASELHIVLPKPRAETMTALNQVLPPAWSHQNPVDIIGDAPPERYHAAIDVCAKDPDVDGLLALLVPVAMTNPTKVAKQIIKDAAKCGKPVLACWMGGKQVRTSWKLFAKHQLPCFETPEEAVEAFSYLADYQRNQQLLLQVPPPYSSQPKPDLKGARTLLQAVLAENRKTLTYSESKQLLQAFAISVTKTIEARTADEAAAAAKELGFPVAMKILSPDISHKREAGGVLLDINNEDGVRSAFDNLVQNARRFSADARILGVTVEKMFNNFNNRELLVGVKRDKVFGPVITFGSGGAMVEIMRDVAVALPPLNQVIARHLIERTRIAKALGQFRNMPPANMEAIINVLLRVSEMICELPQIQEMDINPLIANDHDVVAVDARFVVDHAEVSEVPYAHMAICPYPAHLVATHEMKNGKPVTIRPIRPEDAQMEQEFVRQLSQESKYFRFRESLNELSTLMLVRFTQIDYDREMALIATVTENQRELQIGVARYYINPDQESCEFALVVADAWHHQGVATLLMNELFAAAKSHGVKRMSGEIMSQNEHMLGLVKHLGFTLTSTSENTIRMATKILS